jgi:hypothetical protein
MLTEAHLTALVRHSNDDEPDTCPRVEPAVDKREFGRLGTDKHGSQRGSETAAAGV